MLNFKNPPNGTISLQLVLPSPGNPITAFDLPSSHDIITIVHSNSNNSLDDYSSLQSSTFISNNENSAAARTGGGGGGGNLNGGGGCLVFYHLSNLVSPRHILHFEHSNSYEEITCLKYHPKDSSLLGLLKDGIITIYRPQHLLKPFNGFVQSSGKLLDMDWSPVHHHMLAAGCDTGAVKIYDMRSSLSTSILNLNSSSCNSMISWCPSEPHKIASANHDKVMIWDTRGGKGAIVDSLVCSFEPPYGVRQFVWCASDDKSISSIAISNVQSDVEWWNTQDGTLDKVVSEVVDEYSHILSSPVGQSVVTCKLETTDREQLTELRAETRKKNQSSDSLKDSDSENKLFESISKNIRVLLSRRDQTKMSLNMALNIIGYPRPVKSLNSLYDPTQSTECENRKSQLAVSPDPIIGMKWGTPGRLLPMHGGLELLALTSSATLHAISILPPIVDKYMRDEASKRTGSHGLSIESRNIIPMDLPKYSVDGLKRSFVTPTSIRNANVSKVDFNLTIGTMNDMSNEKDTFWKQLENEMLVLQEALEKGYLQGMTLGRI